MKRPWHCTDLRGLEALALVQGGYFDRSDALAHGVGERLLVHHIRSGRYARLFADIYRLRHAPVARYDELLLAWVWSGYRGVVSHQSALALHQLSNEQPERLQLTVPPGFHRDAAPYELHLAQLLDDEAQTVEGVPVTTPARAIADAAAAGADPEQLQRAIALALRRGLVAPDQLRAAVRRPRYRRRGVPPLIEDVLAGSAA